MDILHCSPTIISLCIVSTIVGVDIYDCVCILHLIARSVHTSSQNHFVTYTDDAAVGDVIIGAKPGVVVHFFFREVVKTGSKTPDEFSLPLESYSFTMCPVPYKMSSHGVVYENKM